MQSILILATLFIPPTFDYTPADMARARQAADMKKFVGPRLPSPPRSHSIKADRPQTAKSHTPSPTSRNRQVPEGRTYFDGPLLKNAKGEVIGQRSGCRPCWAVRAGIHYRR